MLRPPTSGTRKGNGAGKGDGWGGPKKGEGHVAEKAPPFTEGNTAAAGPHDMSDQERAEFAKNHVFKLITEAPRHETQLTAADMFMKRVWGQPLARQEVTGKDGAPMVQVYLPSNTRDVAE